MPTQKPDRYLIEVGRRVRLAREAQSMTQAELAQACGLHRTHVGEIERGETNPTVLALRQLASVLGVEPASLLPALSAPKTIPPESGQG